MKLCQLPHTKPKDVGLSPSRLQLIDDLMQSSVDKEMIPGAVVLIARSGKIAHAASFGYQDVDQRTPLTVDSHFRLYSQTKLMVAALVMRLFESGLLSLDHPITTYLPEFGDRKLVLPRKPTDHVRGAWAHKMDVPAIRDITVRDLLTMTSGLAAGLDDVPAIYSASLQKIWSGANFFMADAPPNQPVGTYEENMLEVSKLPLVAQPGTRWSYGIEFDVLTLLLTRLTGCDLNALLHKELLDPLRLDNTDFYCREGNIDKLTTEYSWDHTGKLVVRDPPERAEKVTSADRKLMSGNGLFGGLLSSPADYFVFLQMLLNGGMHEDNQILGRKSVELMTTDHIPWGNVDIFTGPGYGFGYGVAVRRTLAESHLPGSVGEYTWGGAAGTSFFVDPSEDLVGLFFTHVFGYQFNPNADLNNRFKALVYQSLL